MLIQQRMKQAQAGQLVWISRDPLQFVVKQRGRWFLGQIITRKEARGLLSKQAEKIKTV